MEPKIYILRNDRLDDLFESLFFFFLGFCYDDTWIGSSCDELLDEGSDLVEQNFAELEWVEMLRVDSFVFEKFDEADSVDVHDDKIFFVKLEKIFVFTMCNARRDDLCVDLVDVDKIVNDVSDVLAKLDLVEKEQVRLRKIDAKFDLHERNELVTILELLGAELVVEAEIVLFELHRIVIIDVL